MEEDILKNNSEDTIKQINDSTFSIVISNNNIKPNSGYPNNYLLADEEKLIQDQSVLGSEIDAIGAMENDVHLQIEYTKFSLLDKVQTSLEVAGFVPAFGAIPDVVNGIIYLFRGDFSNMGLSFIAAIPIYGDVIGLAAKSVKIAKKVKKGRTALHVVSETRVTIQAQIILDLAKKQNRKRISIFWTKRTEQEAKEVIKKVQDIDSSIQIQMLETTRPGRLMEKHTDILLEKAAKEIGLSSVEIQKLKKNEKLWDTVFQNSSTSKLKKTIETHQRIVSQRYAKKINKDDLVVEFFRKEDGKYKAGQASKAEIKTLLRRKRDARSSNVFDVMFELPKQ